MALSKFYESTYHLRQPRRYNKSSEICFNSPALVQVDCGKKSPTASDVAEMNFSLSYDSYGVASKETLFLMIMFTSKMLCLHFLSHQDQLFLSETYYHLLQISFKVINY